MSQIIITEDCDLESIDNQIIEEETLEEGKSQKNYYISGPYLSADTKNGNGRIYPHAVLESQVQKYTKSHIATNRAMGELGHPSTTEINLDRVSHLIKELKMDGKHGIGKSLVMDTPMGKIAKSLIEAGVKLGVSTRGVGTLKDSIVQNDFRLLTVDIVADPSAKDAFVNGILESQTEWVMENGILVEKEIEQLKEKLDEYAKEDILNATKKVFEDFLNILASKG